MSQTGGVSAIVVTWNSGREVGGCAAALARQTHPHVELVLVDNGSQDDSIARVLERRPPDRVIRNRRNEGFCRAANQGILASTGEFVWVLNPDAHPAPDAAEHLVRAARNASADVGAFSPKLVKPDVAKKSSAEGKVLDSTGIVPNLWRLAPKDRGEWERDTGQYDNDLDIFGPSGAGAFYRRSALESVRRGDEFFDEDFFAYYEDFDLAWRLAREGIRSLFVPEAVVVHARRAADRRWSSASYLKNKYLFLAKNAALRDLPGIVFLTLPLEIAKVIFGLIEGTPHGGAVLAALHCLHHTLPKRNPANAGSPRGAPSPPERWLREVEEKGK